MLHIYNKSPDKMIHTTKQSLANELWVHRTTVTRMMEEWRVVIVLNNLWKKHYIDIINHIKELW